MKDTFWTPERQAALVAAAREDLSASAIARRIGCSRNAVIGRAWRTGVALTAKAWSWRGDHEAAR
ncbi:MAG TPA: GcrA family cell cycle regulator [Caulobacteraceae bacterium]|jgi:hypothetical protein|nr:GcrA family cell cycle regulator [Caulobacteraceae bacterium]